MAHDGFLLHEFPAAKFSALFTASSSSSSSSGSSSALASIFAHHCHIDPFQCVEHDLLLTSTSYKIITASDHPLLDQIAQHLLQAHGKRVRPTILLLLSRAMRRGMAEDPDNKTRHVEEDKEPSIARKSSRYRDALDEILPTQFRLSDIVEVMHTASLLHDDVIDESGTRRNIISVNAAHGNKCAILGGDFLLSRACVQLSRLGNHHVMELMCGAIEDLVKGELWQLKASLPPVTSSSSFPSSLPSPSPSPSLHDTALSLYMTKTYHKTASLIANSCHSSALLAGYSPAMQAIAVEYGRGLGLAFQVVDDILDLVGDSAVMGKNGGWDLTHGVVTAPVLYAMDIDERVRTAVVKGVKGLGEEEQVRRWVEQCGGIEKARQLAEKCGEDAVTAALKLKSSVARSALINLVRIVLDRQK